MTETQKNQLLHYFDYKLPQSHAKIKGGKKEPSVLVTIFPLDVTANKFQNQLDNVKIKLHRLLLPSRKFPISTSDCHNLLTHAISAF